MTEVEVIPELKEIIGALLFGSKDSLSPADIRKVIKQVAEIEDGPGKAYAKVTDKQIQEALEELKRTLQEASLGLSIAQVAKGYRLQNDASCGIWLRQLLDKGRPTRLSHPALETMAIIAYRQPCTRGEVEAVRGVSVDNIVRNLLEMQLIRVVGRSELPGRPWLFGTTQSFLEHFGISNIDELPGLEELRRMEAARVETTTTAADSKKVSEEEPDEVKEIDDED